MEQITFSDPRSRILQFIQNNPSTHLRKIKKSLDYSMGTIQYHVYRLECEGKITSKRNEFYRNYSYVGGSPDNDVIFSVLNLDSPRKILLYVLQHEPCTHREVATGVALTSSTVSWHMKKLVKQGLIKLQYNGKFSVYTVMQKEKLIPLLEQFKSSTWNNVIENMSEMFNAFQSEN